MSTLADKLWPAKIIAKVALSHIPGGRRAASLLGGFKWGRMDNAAYALKIFRLHVAEAYVNNPDPMPMPASFTALEIGPGDSIASALIAAAHGARQTYLIDAGDFAIKDVAFYQRMADDLRQHGVPDVPDLSHARTFDDILTACRALYLTNGLESLRALPASSIDFIWSHSVVEHIRLHEVLPTFVELRRICTPTGRISHNVDLKDHLGQALNNLRFSQRVWEHPIMASSGFYTNRLRASQLLAMMRDSGCRIIKSNTGKWELPTPRSKMAAPFNSMSDADLLAPTLSAVLSPLSS